MILMRHGETVFNVVFGAIRVDPGAEEPGDALHARARAFCAAMAGLPDWSETVVVTHWGVVRSLTGERIRNAERIRIDPTRIGPPPPGV